MSKIDKITIEQKKSIKPFIEEWSNTVLSPSDDNTIRKSVIDLYEYSGNKKPLVFISDGPISCLLSILWFSSKFNLNLNSQLYWQLNSQLYSQLEQFNAQLYAQLDSQIDWQLYWQLNSQLQSQLQSQLNSQLEQFNAQLYAQLDSQGIKNSISYYSPIKWSSWAGYYEFMSRIGVKFDKTKRTLFNNFANNVVCFFQYKSIVFVSRKPVTRGKNKLLHSENSPAIEFKDGFSVYCLNGVTVPKEIVLTPAEKLDVKLVVTEQNAGVRREIVRKIGIERVCQKLNAKVIDKSDDGMYELLLLDLNDGRKRPYLKMRNPSIRTYHLEGVPPEIDTVEKALNWRNNKTTSPLILT